MLSAIGDAVHVLPVASALKRAWPECRITWIIQPVAHDLVADHPAIDDFIVFERHRGFRSLESFRAVAGRLKEKRFDLLLALQVYLKAGVITGLAQARVKLGFDRRRARDLQWLFTNERIPPHAAQHVQDQYFEFLHYLGIDPEPVTWDLSLSDEERHAQTDFFRTLDAPACAVVVATSKPEKNWAPERYAELIERIEVDFGLVPVLVGGPSPMERRIAGEVLSTTGAHAVDALGDDLRRLVYIVEGSALLVTPDTGPLHIGRALGTPVVSLFGRTNPKRSGPYRAYRELIVDGYAEHPGEEYAASPAHRDGMRRVTTDEVVEKVALAMEKYVKPRRV